MCRLKDPKFILNLKNSASFPTSTSTPNSNSNSSTATQLNSAANSIAIKQQRAAIVDSNPLVNVDSAKYRSINEQIFNELIQFQDPSYSQPQPSNPSRSSRSNTSTSSSSQSINQAKMLKKTATTTTTTQQFHQYHQETTYTSQTSSSNKKSGAKPHFQEIPIGFDENLISIQLSEANTGKSHSGSAVSSSSSSVDQHTVIPVSNPDNHKFITLRPTPPKNAPKTQQANTNTNSVWSDSGYGGESSRKSDNKSSYYSDISITVYDNIVGSNSAHANGTAHVINHNNSKAGLGNTKNLILNVANAFAFVICNDNSMHFLLRTKSDNQC